MKLKLIQKYKKDTAKALQKGYLNALKEITDLVEEKAKEYAPVDTSNLRNKISSKIIKKTSSIVSSKAPYSIYQEQGTIYMSAANRGKGFFKPAVQFVRTRISAIVGKNLRSAFRR